MKRSFVILVYEDGNSCVVENTLKETGKRKAKRRTHHRVFISLFQTSGVGRVRRTAKAKERERRIKMEAEEREVGTRHWR